MRSELSGSDLRSYSDTFPGGAEGDRLRAKRFLFKIPNKCMTLVVSDISLEINTRSSAIPYAIFLREEQNIGR
jgi:hypothetical protein